MFNQGKDLSKYNIEERNGELNIEFRWMSLVAYFLVFFCIIWNGFLVFWYSIALADGIWIMMVFPLIHVAVGIGLTYYTICMFVNKTLIKVSRDEISISFTPLPWKGAKTINTSDITQFYVKQKVSNGKNGQTVTYELWMKDQTGRDKKFSSGPDMSTVEEVRLLEEQIEKFLGIRDQPVQGEYDAASKMHLLEKQPREQHTKVNPTNITLQNLNMGAVLNYDLKSWEVVYEAQYDWTNGQTDKLYRLIPEDGGSMLLYVRQDMGVIEPWLEEKLQGGSQAAFSKLDPATAPEELRFGDQTYWKQSFLTGKVFSSDNNEAVQVKQWFYMATNQSLRIVQFDGNSISVFVGKKKEEYEFINILPAG